MVLIDPVPPSPDLNLDDSSSSSSQWVDEKVRQVLDEAGDGAPPGPSWYDGRTNTLFFSRPPSWQYRDLTCSPLGDRSSLSKDGDVGEGCDDFVHHDR